MGKNNIGQRILHFPLIKIIIGIVICVGIATTGQMLGGLLLNLTGIELDFKKLILGVVAAVLSVIAYIYLFRIYEKRTVAEFSTTGILKYLTGGIILGAGLQALTIIVIYLNDGYSIVSVNPILFLIPPLTLSITSAIVEEILFRGILFRIIEEKLGSYMSLIISACIFGALHLLNPNSSLIVGIGLALQAGLLLGVAYMYSRNLWFPIAIHFAWNFTETAVFGAAVSGNQLSKTLISSKITGAEWFTGGEFGPEGSIQATLFSLVVTIVLLFLCHREEKIIKPYRKGNKTNH